MKPDGTSPRIDQKLRTKYKNDPDVKGTIIEPSLPNRETAIDWEKNIVKEFQINNGNQNPINQKRPK